LKALPLATGRRRRAKLTPVWTLSTGVNEGHQAPPIVNNGVMFVATPQAQVLALNARTGDVLWRYKRELPEDPGPHGLHEPHPHHDAEDGDPAVSGDHRRA
jgi:outer membrane protein assembly factor BamB